MAEIIGVQYFKGYGVSFFLAPKEKIEPDTLVVVEGEHGIQIARVTRTNHTIPDECLPKNLRPIVRVASGRDHEQLKKNTKKEREAYLLCRQKVKEKNLQMKLVDVSYTLDGRKAIFFFTAENRVDFRELVKDLAQAFKIKIEMRQIGVRDEARRLGGVGCCGRSLCCASFLKDFSSVSIRMAKEQNVSLNPTKVSGLCGRLMCCLAYEYEGTGAKHKKRKCEPGKQGEKTEQTSGDVNECQCEGCGEHQEPTQAVSAPQAPVETVEKPPEPVKVETPITASTNPARPKEQPGANQYKHNRRRGHFNRSRNQQQRSQNQPQNQNQPKPGNEPK